MLCIVCVAMSFGFSIGDFITVGKIISDIISALRDSKSEYQALIREHERFVMAETPPAMS